MARYIELFLDPQWIGDTIVDPGYAPIVSANPFDVFRQIPAVSRYQFLLDDARYVIMGFIKGPVCRGQVALNVIEDHFWVFFSNPDEGFSDEDRRELTNEVADYLQMPSSTQTFNVLAAYGKYWEGQKAWLAWRENYFKKLYDEKGDEAYHAGAAAVEGE